VWTQDDSGRVHTPFEPVVLAATLALIPVLIVKADAKSNGWQTFAYVTNWAIWQCPNERRIGQRHRCARALRVT
jgi:hypothetical protein